ncbi:MAG: hypothetical protein AAFX39_16520 [Pseudomonadota bacterium]
MNDDNRSRHIGSVLGPILLVVTISEWINIDIWSENLPPVTYLNGVMLFAAGLAIVRFHSRWRPIWTASITIVGWLMIAGGAYRLFFPTAPQADPTPMTYTFIAIIGALGAIMTFRSYLR